MLKRIAFMYLATLAYAVTPAAAQDASQPSYTLDSSQTRVLELSNLSSDTDCHPDRLVGQVVKREFDQRGLSMIGITLEERDGARSFVNVESNLENADRVTKGWVMRGLQTLLREGNRVSLGVRRCGAAGRVMILDRVRLAR